MLANLTVENDDQKQGVAIVCKALEAPLRQIAENSRVESSIVAGKLRDAKSTNFGFDAQREAYVDLVERGIIDPTKVVRVALQDAASVAGLLITTEAMIADAPKKKSGGAGCPAAWAAWTCKALAPTGRGSWQVNATIGF